MRTPAPLPLTLLRSSFEDFRQPGWGVFPSSNVYQLYAVEKHRLFDSSGSLPKQHLSLDDVRLHQTCFAHSIVHKAQGAFSSQSNLHRGQVDGLHVTELIANQPPFASAFSQPFSFSIWSK